MPYIGKSPVSGGFHKLGNLTASATATYALTLNGAAYFPETANQLLVSLNGVIQAPQDSFTVSGSNLIFDSALTASDSIDFVVALGDVLGVQGVTDGAVSTNKIANGAVTAAKLASGAVTAAKMPTGAVLQVQQSIGPTSVQDISSTSFVDTGLSVDITPRDANSKFLIQGAMDVDIDANEQTFFTVFRDATDLGSTNGLVNTWNGTNRMIVPITILVLDSPSTASTITYKIKIKNAAGTVRLNSQSCKIIMTVSEIAG
jgi:hypothetical protein